MSPLSDKEDKRIFDLLTRLTKTLGELLGQSTEVVLHDLRQADSTIVAISNPQLTGRKIGDTLDNLGLHLFESHNFDDMANYETRTKTGKVLRSCSVFVRDDEGTAIGALCVNQDMSALLKLREWLDQALETHKAAEETTHTDNNVEDVLSQLIEDAIRSTGKSASEFTREDKIAVISYLDARGAFLIRYSMEKVASLLGISKFSIYNYLNDMRADAISTETAKV
jgi:predicted transcriptional regulator YheO